MPRERCDNAHLPLRDISQRNRRCCRGDGFPAIVKRVDSQASRGVTKVYTAEPLQTAYDRASSQSHSGGVLVERLLVGTEGSIESIVDGSRITVLGICSKRKCKPPFCCDLELRYPGDFSATTFASIEALNAKAIEAVGITDGLAHVEFVVSGGEAALTGIDVPELRIRQVVGDDITIP